MSGKSNGHPSTDSEGVIFSKLSTENHVIYIYIYIYVHIYMYIYIYIYIIYTYIDILAMNADQLTEVCHLSDDDVNILSLTLDSI